MDKLQIIGNKIQVITETSTYIFDCSKLSAYSTDVKDYDIEYIYANLINNKYLCVIVTVASGQAGIIAVVDIVADKIIHVHNGSFAMAALVLNDKVISFHFISYWGHIPSYTIESTDLNNMSMETESKIFKIQSEISLDLSDGKVDMTVNESKLEISDGKNIYKVDISELL